MSNIITKYTTNNPTYSNPSTINVKHLVLHSIGVGQPSADVMWGKWNKATAETSVHGVIDDTKTYLMLPCMEKQGKAYRCWGCGKGSKGSYNNSAIQVEMCEHSSIKYTSGANFTTNDKNGAIEFTKKTTQNAVDLFAKLCIFHKLDPLGKNVIETHRSANSHGMASGHADCDHLWNQLGMNYTLEDFKQDVKNRIEELEDEDMTQEKFNELMENYLNGLNNEKAYDYQNIPLAWAKEQGILVGDTEGNQMPQAFLTRGDMAVILNSFYNKVK